MASLCHPWFTTTKLSYRFPIFETSATALCGCIWYMMYDNMGVYIYIYVSVHISISTYKYQYIYCTCNMIYDLYVWVWYSNIVRIEGGRPPSPLKLCFIPFFLLGCVNKTVLAHRDVHKPRKAIAAKSIPPGAASFFTRVWKRQNSVIQRCFCWSRSWQHPKYQHLHRELLQTD